MRSPLLTPHCRPNLTPGDHPDATPSYPLLTQAIPCPRYRATPTFGRDTIRKFGVNASDMKRKAARDFEDLLQASRGVAISVLI